MSKPDTNPDSEGFIASQHPESNVTINVGGKDASDSASDALTQTTTKSESNDVSEDHKTKAVTLTDFLSSLNGHLQEVYRRMGVHVSPYSTPDNSYLGVKFSYRQVERTLDSDPTTSEDSGVPTGADGSGEESRSAGGARVTGREIPSEDIRRKMAEMASGISTDDDHLNALLAGYPWISEEDALNLKRQGAAFEILKSGLESMGMKVEVDDGNLHLKTTTGRLPQYASLARLHGLLADCADLMVVLSNEVEVEVEVLDQSDVQGAEEPEGQNKGQGHSCVVI
ncbi:hypothetical protein EHS25_000678 [Saitozyma podzolica]|uniref:Uncharacterized protein n=1 Tax=Saitozyma podzolica TaxID=1890683 RepID=A0A427YWZ5_9TREE|nr:hypothetical protein EHS25_000678 [Saitozyma podzolica]